MLALVVAASFAPIARADSDDDDSSANNFDFSSFDGKYYLTRDAKNRSVLEVDETLVAEFPDADQNHGIERAVPVSFDGHPVFDGKIAVWRDGEPEPINSTRTDGNYEVFQIGDKHKYVTGAQTYRIKYAFRDVNYARLVDGRQIFAWQGNGGDWKQSFDSARATITIDPALVSRLANLKNGANLRCYAGKLEDFRSQSADQDFNNCTIARVAKNEFRVATGMLFPGETLAFGADFAPGTFANFSPDARQILVILVLAILPIFTFGAAIFLVFTMLKYGRHAKTDHPIVPQYAPPVGQDIVTLSRIYHRDARGVLTAILLGLATRGNIKIVEQPPSGLWKTQNFSLELLSENGADDIERKYLHEIFNGQSTTFDFREAAKKRPALGQHLGQILLAKTQSIEGSSLFKPRDKITRAVAIAIVGSVAVFALNLFATTQNWLKIAALDPLFLANGLVAVTLIIFGACCLAARPRSEAGAELRDYLLGLKMFMTVAESERIKILQSVKGAARDDVSGEKIVKLYEKLMPFAVIFGIEKSWAFALQIHYADGASPDWYQGTGAFNAAVFASSLSIFSSSVNSYSSSSGGSGGSSGGGGAGGGGGGGGW